MDEVVSRDAEMLGKLIAVHQSCLLYAESLELLTEKYLKDIESPFSDILFGLSRAIASTAKEIEGLHCSMSECLDKWEM